jgi:hypothetical protein
MYISRYDMNCLDLHGVSQKNQLPKGVEFASTAADSPRNAASGPRRVGGDPALEKVPRREKMFPDLARGE